MSLASKFEQLGLFSSIHLEVVCLLDTFTGFELSGLSNMRKYHPDNRNEKDMEK